MFVGALAYADDIVLLAPTPRAMCHMLQICESYGQEFFIQFNANKSACMLVGKKFVSVRHKVQFYIDGQQIPVVDDFLHLSHTVVSQLDDNKEEIWNKRNELCGKINNVLCYFKCCDPVVKVRLLRSYCSDLYGSVLWDMSANNVENICIAWRKSLRRLWELPFQTHSRFIEPICELLPITDELLCRCTAFIVKCLVRIVLYEL